LMKYTILAPILFFETGSVLPNKGVIKGVGLTPPPLSLIFYKKIIIRGVYRA